MGTIISSTGVCKNGNEQSVITLASSAAFECIDKAGVDKNDIDLIINTGVYRDENMVEPAIAALVQQRMEINLRFQPEHHTFAFDIIGGACGMLSAVHATSALMANGRARRVLIVSCDVHPSGSKVTGFPYSSLGAAMLLEWSDDPTKGFQAIDFKTSPSGYVGTVGKLDIIKHGINSINTIDVHIEPDFEERACSFTIETIRSLLSRYKSSHSIDTSRIKLIPTHLWKNFGNRVSQGLGFREFHQECLFEKYGNPHSAALTVAFHEALTTGVVNPGDQLMLLAASASLTVGAGLYFA